MSAVKLTGSQFTREAAGKQLYSSSDAKVLDWPAAYLQALGRSGTAALTHWQVIYQRVGEAGSERHVG